ncbi:ArAE-2 domain-containing protein [Mycena venus]|uniref:ArAE-2 domain-containing protein n=1 Tax=Mycena venus TaxID=2733690 RepID=A0A8H6X5V2_9AGAR|nr:ArAE-2 domain-containing protein [Mycena venus]
MHPPQNDDDLDEYDSDSTSSTATTASFATSPYMRWLSLPPFSTVPLLYRNIFKCALAYFIVSLFTFSPSLSSLLRDLPTYGDVERPSPSGYLVATVAVHFNPAKTMGGMIEADLYFIAGLVYSAFVCLSSMSVFWWLESKPGWGWLANAVVIVWVGVSFSVVAWMKVWMASPSFNVACTMTAIIIFVVIIKEGGLETLLQVSFTVLYGSVISNLVCYAIWPQSATSALQTDMITTLDSFSTLLALVTHAFHFEEGILQPNHERLTKAVASHQNSFTTLKKT